MNYVWIGKLFVCFTWLVQSISQLKRLRGSEWGRWDVQCPSVGSIRAAAVPAGTTLPFVGALLLLPLLALGIEGSNTFQKIFKLRLLLGSWAPPLYTVLLNTSFALYWWQGIFQALHRFSVTAQFSFLSGYSVSQHLGLFYETLIFPPLFFFFLVYDPFRLTSQCTEAM